MLRALAILQYLRIDRKRSHSRDMIKNVTLIREIAVSLITLAYSSLISKQHFKVDSNNEIIIKDLHPCCWYLPLINYVCYLITLSFLYRLFICFFCWFISCDVTIRERHQQRREQTAFNFFYHLYILKLVFLLNKKKLKVVNWTFY